MSKTAYLARHPASEVVSNPVIVFRKKPKFVTLKKDEICSCGCGTVFTPAGTTRLEGVGYFTFCDDLKSVFGINVREGEIVKLSIDVERVKKGGRA